MENTVWPGGEADMKISCRRLLKLNELVIPALGEKRRARGRTHRIPPFAAKLKNQKQASPQTMGHPRVSPGTERQNHNVQSLGHPACGHCVGTSIWPHSTQKNRSVQAVPFSPPFSPGSITTLPPRPGARGFLGDREKRGKGSANRPTKNTFEWQAGASRHGIDLEEPLTRLHLDLLQPRRRYQQLGPLIC